LNDILVNTTTQQGGSYQIIQKKNIDIFALMWC